MNEWMPQPRTMGLFDFENWSDWEIEPPEGETAKILPRFLSPILTNGDDAKEIYLRFIDEAEAFESFTEMLDEGGESACQADDYLRQLALAGVPRAMHLLAIHRLQLGEYFGDTFWPEADRWIGRLKHYFSKNAPNYPHSDKAEHIELNVRIIEHLEAKKASMLLPKVSFEEIPVFKDLDFLSPPAYCLQCGVKLLDRTSDIKNHGFPFGRDSITELSSWDANYVHDIDTQNTKQQITFRVRADFAFRANPDITN
jgi:hypothetical protein